MSKSDYVQMRGGIKKVRRNLGHLVVGEIKLVEGGKYECTFGYCVNLVVRKVKSSKGGESS